MIATALTIVYGVVEMGSYTLLAATNGYNGYVGYRGLYTSRLLVGSSKKVTY